eukprot:scaffold35308_cov32-Tisochrysis_lutea.AAC.4
MPRAPLGPTGRRPDRVDGARRGASARVWRVSPLSRTFRAPCARLRPAPLGGAGRGSPRRQSTGRASSRSIHRKLPYMS